MGSPTDDREVVLERFVVRIEKAGKWHYLAARSQFMTICGVYVPPAPEEKGLVGRKKLAHRSKKMCKKCQKNAEKHANTGRTVRLAHTGEGRGNASFH
jgi:hypothetical protein